MERFNFDLERLHAIQLEMLKKLIKVCEEYNISYFLAFGSLLGAVRNHKIIEWDDSIDVVMSYADYKKLLSLPKEVWHETLFLQTYTTDPQYPKFYAKLRNSSTTLIKSDYAVYDINHGIYINIMPVINLSDNEFEREQQLNDAKLLKALMEKRYISTGNLLLRLRSLLLLTFSDLHKVKKLEKMKASILRYEGKDTRDCFVLAGNASLNLPLRRSWFASAVKCDFEGIKVNIPKGWHEWLTLRYGDYMTVPIHELQGNKISKFVTLNTQRPYTDYKGRSYCVQSAEGQ